MKKLISFVLSFALVLTMAGILTGEEKKPQETRETIKVMVSIPPLADFVENVGGDKVEVAVLIPPGAEPHTYEPTPSQLVEVSRATLFIKNGVGLEFWIDKITKANPDILLVDTSKGIKLMEMEEHEHQEHHQRPEGHHHHGLDPHIWLSPANAKIQVENIYQSLIRVNPQNKTYYAQNKKNYLEKLESLDKEIKKGLSPVKNRSFIVFHPPWDILPEITI